MSEATTATALGDWRPVKELAKETPYTNHLACRRWLLRLGVPVVPVRRIPHARREDIQAAVERLAARGKVTA